jgi:hypothetical protein
VVPTVVHGVCGDDAGQPVQVGDTDAEDAARGVVRRLGLVTGVCRRSWEISGAQLTKDAGGLSGRHRHADYPMLQGHPTTCAGPHRQIGRFFDTVATAPTVAGQVTSFDLMITLMAAATQLVARRPLGVVATTCPTLTTGNRATRRNKNRRLALGCVEC